MEDGEDGEDLDRLICSAKHFSKMQNRQTQQTNKQELFEASSVDVFTHLRSVDRNTTNKVVAVAAEWGVNLEAWAVGSASGSASFSSASLFMSDDRYPSDTQFAGLVEAATAAADQEIHWSNNADPANLEPRLPYEGYGDHVPMNDAQNAAQTGQYSDTYPSESVGPSTRKRKRAVEKIAAQYDEEAPSITSPYQTQTATNQSTIAPPSAAALFRQPLASTKKYTRPPIRKLYSSLELSPENFLHLQSAAKGYMLDEDHPERRDTIGQRGRGDTDLVKLKLWNFVKEFLDDLGNGRKFFGEHVPGAEGQPARTMFWPQDAEQIIKACVPVLRRMVTNERQRQYALEARKGGADAQELRHGENSTRPHSQSAQSTTGTNKTTRKDNMELEILDLLNDSCIPGNDEAAYWFDEHGRHPIFSNVQSLSSLNERDYRILVANIDGHYRILHQFDSSQCKEDCEAQTIERLLGWDRLYSAEVTHDVHERKAQMFLLIRQLCDLIRAHSHTQDLHANTEDESHGDREARDPTLQPPMANKAETFKRKTRSGKQPEPRFASKPVTKARNGVLDLHINLVSTAAPSTPSSLNSTKRLAPPFSINAVAVPNLNVLSTKIEEHYGMNLRNLLLLDPSSSAGQVSTGSEAIKMNIRVWLPDGLVRIRDDGEWMVALLSAEMIEWMDNEAKILVDLVA